MAAEPGVLDFRFLRDSTTKLLGYFVCTWFTHYLGVIAHAFARLEEHGMTTGWMYPTEQGKYSVPFDFNALSFEKLTYINGIYFYVLACHKAANYRLMNRSEDRRILFLRGYDYEFSISAGAGQASSISSMDTAHFGFKLDELLAPHFHLFKVMAGKDVYWGTIDAQNYFGGNFGEVARRGLRPTRSIYMNAHHWKEDLAGLLDRMDHYLVYVSSITDSLLWELSQLDQDGRRDRVTIVFDQWAIQNKETHSGLLDGMRGDGSIDLIWESQGKRPGESLAELRERLERSFLVTTPEDFERDIELHRRRIAAHSGALGPGARESWVDFRFFPSIDAPDLVRLRDFSAAIEQLITETVADAITSLPLFFCHVQLRIFLTLLLGEHDSAGRALARYAAVIDGTSKRLDLERLPEEGRDYHRRLLEDHLAAARHIGFHMLAFGRSHEFGDYTAAADADFDSVFDSTLPAVIGFFDEAAARAEAGPRS